ncbi:unnamed protein product [Caretta caretta]
MDFREILMVASEQQGLSAVSKRYSLAVGPPKKDPKVKGVHSAAVQAFLRRKEEENRGKELEAKRKKEELLAKRIELKHDRKARAMASRTKDNFYGYNGIPVEEKPKKRQTCESVDRCTDAEYMTEDEAERFEYSQTESEHEPEEYEEKPSKAAVKPKALPKSAPTPMNFVDLLRLAEKKQYEPVEIKVVKKTEERPRTAEELREREFLDRKNKKGETQKEKKKPEKEIKNVTSNKVFSHKEFINAKLSKNSVDKHSSSKGSFPSQCGADKKSSGPVFSNKHARSSSSSKSSQVEKAKVTQNGSLKRSSSGIHSKSSVNGVGKFGSSSHTPSSKAPANGAQKLQSAKELNLKKSTSVHTKLVSRPSNAQMNGTRPPPGHRPVFHPQGLPRPSLPPISYKRQIEDDEEYDSEMDDFIDDEGQPQEEISKHIREIFGYDRNKYKDESDYALRYMESSWKEQQKEEARSLRLGVQEDLEELRREEEELKLSGLIKKPGSLLYSASSISSLLVGLLPFDTETVANL